MVMPFYMEYDVDLHLHVEFFLHYYLCGVPRTIFE